jgi:hypothetical protein
VEDGVFSYVVTNFGFTLGTEDKSGPQKIAKEIWRVLRGRRCCDWYDLGWYDTLFIGVLVVCEPCSNDYSCSRGGWKLGVWRNWWII